MMTRRQALKQTALAGAICAATSFDRAAVAQPPPPPPRGTLPPDRERGAFPPGRREPLPPPESEMIKLPPLPYAVDALEPFIDAQTMEIHHGKHHAAYVANLNKALADMPEWHHKSPEQIMRDLNTLPDKVRTAVRNHGGGHYNHSLFWPALRKGAGGEARGELGRAIAKTFGGFAGFKEQLTDTAIKTFGSGWAWLVVDGRDLRLQSTPNQDCPITTGQYPLVGIDVWEHAYYLKHQNRRPDWIEAWFNVVDWDHINQRYVKHMA